MGMDIDSLVRINKEQLSTLEKSLGYRFTDLRLLQKSLVHSSYAFEQGQGGQDNENLEFIGDAVLDLVIGNILFHRYLQMRESAVQRHEAEENTLRQRVSIDIPALSPAARAVLERVPGLTL